MTKLHQDKHVKFFIRAFHHFVPMHELLDIGIATESSIQSTYIFSNITYCSTEFVFIDFSRSRKIVMSADYYIFERIEIRLHTNTDKLAYKPFSYYQDGDEVYQPSMPLGKFFSSKEKILSKIWDVRKNFSSGSINLDDVVKDYGLLT